MTDDLFVLEKQIRESAKAETAKFKESMSDSDKDKLGNYDLSLVPQIVRDTRTNRPLSDL